MARGFRVGWGTRLTVASAGLSWLVAVALASAPVIVRAQDPNATPSAPLPQVLEQFARTQTAQDFDPVTGHLRALLRALDIPIESQVLVFSKTSLQTAFIAPRVPRAIYFNDSAYVGYVADSLILEVILPDPARGFAFFQIEQKAGAPNPQPDYVCALCHDPGRTGVPRPIMRSHFTDSEGNAIQRRGQMDQLLFETTDQSPFERRWGGWYVTGTHGALRHLGNTRASDHVSHINDPVAYVKTMDFAAGANVTSLVARVDPRPYLTLESDIVALMVLGHQTTVDTAIVSVRRALLARDAGGSTAEASPAELAAIVDPLVNALLLVKAAPLPGPVQGTTAFRQVFEAAGIKDSRGRSLRALDLEHRLLRYPVSYMLYGKSFNTLPEVVKTYVYRRIADELIRDVPSRTSEVDAAGRAAAIEILRDTKPDLAPFLAAP
jgi:hypothetical protein